MLSVDVRVELDTARGTVRGAFRVRAGGDDPVKRPVAVSGRGVIRVNSKEDLLPDIGTRIDRAHLVSIQMDAKSRGRIERSSGPGRRIWGTRI